MFAIWLILFAIFALAALAAGIWAIVRFARSGHVLLIPVTLVALLGLGAALMGGLYFVRLEVHEDVRRAEARQELETLSLALHEYRAEESRPRAIVESEPAVPSQVLDWRGTSDEQPATSHDESATPVPDADDPSLELVAYVGRDVVGQRLPKLPEWVESDPEIHRLIDERREVLVSDQWATLEEADAQLTNLAAIKLSNYLAWEHPSAAGWMPDAETIVQSGAVTRRLHETSTLPIGEFNPSLYRMYWELELTPDVRARLLEAWRPFAVQQRITWLGIGIGVLTLAFALVGGLLRKGSHEGRRQRSIGPATVAAVVIAAGAATVMLT